VSATGYKTLSLRHLSTHNVCSDLA
jgi:hypothetical protein